MLSKEPRLNPLNFCTPHCHQQSIDSASTPEAFIKREQELGTGYTTVTDHGFMGGCRKVYDLAKKASLKPILGVEGYFFDPEDVVLKSFGIEGAEALKEYVGNYYHVTLHFRTQQAYELGCKLISRADDRAITVWGERKPPFTWADLEALGAADATCGSGCFGGMVQDHIAQHGRADIAEAYYKRLRSIFKPGHFFAEVFPHRLTHEWDDGVHVHFANGTERKFKSSKKLRVNTGEEVVEVHADKYAKQFDKKKSGELLAVMNNRVWEDEPTPLEIVSVKQRSDFVQNECSPLRPNGDLQWAANRYVMALANKYGDPILVSDDSHFATPNEKVVQDIRLSSFGRIWKFFGSYHRQSGTEAFDYFSRDLGIDRGTFDKWIQNSYQFASLFDGFKFTDRKQLPTKFYPEDTLKHFKSLIDHHGRMDWANPQWVARLKSEISLLKYNGTIDLLPYFFTAENGTRFYEQELHKLTGPGRGSAAGMLSAYLLGITHVDPLRYDLSQDRFLTVDRVQSGKFPDIDQDLPERDSLMDPVNGWLEKNFSGHYAQISADTTLKLRSAVKDVCRVNYGKVPRDVEELTSNFENAPQGITDHDFVFGFSKGEDEFVPGSITTDKALQEFIAKYPKEWDTVKMCLGLARQKTRHASGVVIVNEPIENFIPLMTISGNKCTQYDMRSVEAVGGIKMDYLVVNSLNDIDDALKMIRERTRPDIKIDEYFTIDNKRVPSIRVVPDKTGRLVDVWDLPEDIEVFRDICDSNTDKSVFQFGTPSAQQWLKLFKRNRADGKPSLSSIKDLAAFTALDRPGPLDYKVEGKHNMLVEYAHRAAGETGIGRMPILDKLFPDTYGIIVFQEQIQKAFQEVGGTTGIQANAFREHIGKKKMDLVFKDRELFMPGALAKLGETDAQKLWDSMETFGQYGFNASHAVCYSVIGYACAWLRHHYPLEWWCSVMKNASKSEINENFWPQCGSIIDLPDVNTSGDTFTIHKDRILAPLSLVKGIGPEAHKQLCEGRPFIDIQDMCNKMATRPRNALNTGVVPNLIVSGVMDSLFPKDSTLIDKFEAYQNALAKAFNKKKVERIKKCEQYASINVYQRYQLIKSLMPEFSTSLIKMMSDRGEPGVIQDDMGCLYQNEFGGRVKQLRLVNIEEVDKALLAQPWIDGGLTVAVAAYVSEDRRFKYGEGKKKEAAALTMDIEGATRSYVKWPPRTGNKLPEEWKQNLTGSIVIVTLEKYREDRPFAVQDVVLVQPPFENKKEKE